MKKDMTLQRGKERRKKGEKINTRERNEAMILRNAPNYVAELLGFQYNE